MASAAGSLFARTYAGHTGVDPYTTAVSDVYQDLFGEGIFTGKGLYDVDAFMASLEGRVPENALLSHDLFEGLHARAALVTDAEVVDDYPSNVLTHARRQHRWVRGDWQILWWLFPWVPTRSGLERNRLPIISRWKILDNLRRSLVPPSLVALFIAGWAFLPGRPLFWTLRGDGDDVVSGRGARCSSCSAGRARARASACSCASIARGSRHRSRARQRPADVRRLPGVGHARTRSASRWRAWCRAAAASCSGKPPPPSRSARASSTSRGFYDAMRSSPMIAAIGAAGRDRRRVPARWPWRLPILGLWFAAPYIAFLLSKPVPSSRPELSDADRDVPAAARGAHVALLRDLRRPTRTAGCRPTTSSSIPSRASRIAPRRPTSRWRCCRRCRRTTSS